MLTRQQCDEYERYLIKETADRANLGGYDTDALTILKLCQICYSLVRHVGETSQLRPERGATKEDREFAAARFLNKTKRK